MTVSIDAEQPSDPLNQRYQRAIHRAQAGAHDNPRKRQRFYVMQQLAETALANGPGCIAEFGCWHGHSTLMLEEIARGGGRKLHTYDSFEGLSPFTAADKTDHFATTQEVQAVSRSFASDYGKLSRLIDPAITSLHRGWIPAVLHETPDPGVIAFAHIDVDLYTPTGAAAFFAYERLAKGGVIFFDDYGHSGVWPGATKAIHDLLSSEGAPQMFIKLPYGSAFLVK